MELGLDRLGSHLLNLGGEDLGRRGRAVNAVCLDGDENTASDLKEPVGVHGDNTSLVRLGNIGKDDIDHGDNHAVTSRLTGVFDDGDNVGSLRGHADQVTARSGRELDGINITGWANNIGNVRDRGTGSSTEVEHTGARSHVDVVGTASDGGAKLASERIPHAVLNLCRRCGAIVVLDRLVDGNSLLAIDRLARREISGGNAVFLAATDDENAGVTVRLLKMCFG